MYYQPSPIDWHDFHFLITSSPDNDSMKKCIKVRLDLSHAEFYLGLKKVEGEAADKNM